MENKWGGQYFHFFAYFQILDYKSAQIVKDKKFVICFRIPIELSIGAVQINFFMYDH